VPTLNRKAKDVVGLSVVVGRLINTSTQVPELLSDCEIAPTLAVAPVVINAPPFRLYSKSMVLLPPLFLSA
jgi:hypothetical protein